MTELDLILEKYKDYVLGSQNVYFTGSKLALDRKEAKQEVKDLINGIVQEEGDKAHTLTDTSETITDILKRIKEL
jgi:hypothetical protein